MAKQVVNPDFSKMLINDDFKQSSFLLSRMYSWELKKLFLETLLGKKSEEEQIYFLTKFKNALTPVDPNPYPTLDIQFASGSVSDTQKKDIDFYGIQPDIPLEKRNGHNYGFDTYRLVNWLNERLEETKPTLTTKIKCEFYPSEFALLFKLLIEKGWIKADFDNKQNISKLSKILLDTFEVKSPDGKIVTPNALADKFNEKRNKAHSEFKKDIRKGIFGITHYRKKLSD